MNRFSQMIRRAPSAILLAVVGAAILAAGAHAERPNDRAGLLGVGGVSSDLVAPTNPGWGAAGDWARNHAERPAQQKLFAPTNPGWGAAGDWARDHAERSAQPSLFAPTNPGWGAAGDHAKLPATPNVPATGVAIRPDDRGDARGPGGLAAPPLGVPAASGHPFQWDDAAAGAVAMLGALLLGAAIALMIRGRRRVALS
jgi:hypothetical protein